MRAIEVMAGADALGGFVSLTAQESFAIEYWPLELYKLSLAPPPRRAAGRGRARHRRRRRDRPRDRRRARRRRRLRGRARPRRRRCARRRRAPGRRAGSAVDGDVTDEASVAAAFAAAVERFGGVDIVVSNAGHRVQRADRGDDARASGTATTPCSARATSSSRARRSGVLERQGTGGSIVFVGLQERAGGGQERGRLLVGQGRRAAPRPLPGRGGRAGRASASTPSTPTPCSAGSRIWDSSWREERAARLRHRPRRARGALPRAHDAEASTSCPQDIARRCCTSPRRPLGQERRATCSTSTAACRPLTRAERRA